MDDIRTELANLAQLASQRHPIELLDSLPPLLDSAVDTIDVGLWDLQQRDLFSLRDGERIDADGWTTSTVLEHHGNRLGRLFVSTRNGDNADAIGDLVEALAPIIALNITSAYDFDDRPWTTVRTKEMSLAAEIQATVIPPPSCWGVGFGVSAAVEPAYDTGGDIFDYVFDGERLFLAVLDAVGHGLAASHLASLATAALRRARREAATLPEILRQVDDSIRGQYGGSAYVSVVIVDIDTSSGRANWVSAGHLPPLVLRGGEIRELAIEPILPLGMWITGDESFDNIPIGTLSMERGDAIVLYSDGVIENLMASSDDVVGDERFRQAIESHGRPYTHRSARDVVEELLRATGPVLRDDATLMIAHRSERS